VDREDVGAAEAEDQEHFDGPGADAADGDEAFDEFFVGQFFACSRVGDDARRSFSWQVLHSQNFLPPEETGFAEDGLAEL